MAAIPHPGAPHEAGDAVLNLLGITDPDIIEFTLRVNFAEQTATIRTTKAITDPLPDPPADLTRVTKRFHVVESPSLDIKT